MHISVFPDRPEQVNVARRGNGPQSLLVPLASSLWAPLAEQAFHIPVETQASVPVSWVLCQIRKMALLLFTVVQEFGLDKNYKKVVFMSSSLSCTKGTHTELTSMILLYCHNRILISVLLFCFSSTFLYCCQSWFLIKRFKDGRQLL